MFHVQPIHPDAGEPDNGGIHRRRRWVWRMGEPETTTRICQINYFVLLNLFKFKFTSIRTYWIRHPGPGNRRGRQQERFRRWVRSWAQNLTFPAGQLNFGEFLRWSGRPIAQWRWKRRRPCGRCIRGFCDFHKSGNGIKFKRKFPQFWTNPFLAVTIHQIVDGTRIPFRTEAEQIPGHEAIFRHNPKILK